MTPGKFNAPGLPNIIGGNINYMDIGIHQPGENAFRSNVDTADSQLEIAGTSTFNSSILLLNASLSNGTYGASNTVMPASTDMTVGLYLGRSA